MCVHACSCVCRESGTSFVWLAYIHILLSQTFCQKLVGQNIIMHLHVEEVWCGTLCVGGLYSNRLLHTAARLKLQSCQILNVQLYPSPHIHCKQLLQLSPRQASCTIAASNCVSSKGRFGRRLCQGLVILPQTTLDSTGCSVHACRGFAEASDTWVRTCDARRNWISVAQEILIEKESEVCHFREIVALRWFFFTRKDIRHEVYFNWVHQGTFNIGITDGICSHWFSILSSKIFYKKLFKFQYGTD